MVSPSLGDSAIPRLTEIGGISSSFATPSRILAAICPAPLAVVQFSHRPLRIRPRGVTCSSPSGDVWCIVPGREPRQITWSRLPPFNRAATRLLRLRCDSGVDDPRIMLSARAQKDPEVSRRVRVRQLFISWYRAKRTANDVLNFYLRLQQHDPGLLPHVEQHYTYRQLKADLDGLYLRER
jgi:hypothetical protein